MGLVIPGSKSSYIDIDAILNVEVEDLIDIDDVIENISRDEQTDKNVNSDSNENVSKYK